MLCDWVQLFVVFYDLLLQHLWAMAAGSQTVAAAVSEWDELTKSVFNTASHLRVTGTWASAWKYDRYPGRILRSFDTSPSNDCWLKISIGEFLSNPLHVASYTSTLCLFNELLPVTTFRIEGSCPLTHDQLFVTLNPLWVKAIDPRMH